MFNFGRYLIANNVDAMFELGHDYLMAMVTL
jgi:hypothetical protein